MLFFLKEAQKTQKCVLQIDKTLTKLENVQKVKNISNYHSVTYQESGVLYQESYNIGKGKLYGYTG